MFANIQEKYLCVLISVSQTASTLVFQIKYVTMYLIREYHQNTLTHISNSASSQKTDHMPTDLFVSRINFVTAYSLLSVYVSI